MTARKEIEILDLLRQREAEFVKIWQCEDGICRLLGLSDFPFGGAPDLPSRKKGKRTVSLASLRKKDAGNDAEGDAKVGKAPPVRKLQGNEDAYRVVFEHNGASEVTFQTDGELLRKLFLVEDTDFKMLSIETVEFHSLEDWKSIEILWSREGL